MMATPPTTSLWPPMYFVVECTTICRSKCQRLLKVWRREGVVDGDELTGAPHARRPPRCRRALSSGLRRRFDPEEFGVRAAWPRATASRSRHVDVGEAQAVARENAFEEPVRAAVEIVADDDVVARRKQVEHGRRSRPCRSRKRAAVSRALERSQLTFEREPRRVDRAAVVEALVLADRVCV